MENKKCKTCIHWTDTHIHSNIGIGHCQANVEQARMSGTHKGFGCILYEKA